MLWTSQILLFLLILGTNQKEVICGFIIGKERFVSRWTTANHKNMSSSHRRKGIKVLQNDDIQAEAEEEDYTSLFKDIMFLGKGTKALVEPGVVLVPPKFETSHDLSRAAVFVYALGLDAYGDAAIRGVVLDNPTPFTISEMAGQVIEGPLGENILFRGGDKGKDLVVMLHSCEDIPSNPVGNGGVFQGGLKYAQQASGLGLVSPDEFKFFFNYVEFRAAELSKFLAEEEDGDAWLSVQLPPKLILDSDLYKGDTWRAIRKSLQL